MRRMVFAACAVAAVLAPTALVASPAWADDPPPVGGDPTSNPPLPAPPPLPPSFGQPLQPGGVDLPVFPPGPYSTPPPAPIAFGPVPAQHLPLPPLPSGRSSSGGGAGAAGSRSDGTAVNPVGAPAPAAAAPGPTLEDFVRSLLRPGVHQVGYLELRPRP